MQKAVEYTTRFLSDMRFSRATWDYTLVCYAGNRRVTRHELEQDLRWHSAKCRWYELELLLESELGLFDPDNPKKISRYRS